MEHLSITTAPKIPASHQEAQDTLTSYLQKTVDALPVGTSLDGSRYGGGDGANYCDDNPASTESPMNISFCLRHEARAWRRLQRDRGPDR
jgi:hypothetical protein